MRSRSLHGGRHELGQNFLRDRRTIDRIVGLVRATDGPILEIGAGDGALTRGLAALGRDVLAVDLDERRVDGLRRRLPSVTVRQADALRVRLDRPVIVGNIPFHLTTPILRRSLAADGWREAIFLTQWEVARKRAGVGGRTMMTAQTAPWFDFALHGRVAAGAFIPRPSVDAGILAISRRATPLVAPADRRAYERFVHAVFTGPGRGIGQILALATPGPRPSRRAALAAAALDPTALPRDLTPGQWATLWHLLGRPVNDQATSPPGGRPASQPRGNRR
ncbi:23S ribosomal RNA methyltransferase Erm [Frankia sp. CNm7]|uniref:23S ribosomal RNA methyltransferase Erm n=1 Tax=Frankia nepalensis TaxID=1836974 RepID=A0A937RPX6_9ACTN|nr:23S ribosomal RNA methyltransferase Erm [Frankia nepalensis]MBL7500469.1 23S ribosomal RNA methyltransferase Erm [Frankia nepalensis]MBL7512821.1 23S ribosomal RNA methyltransferase Erm [Frankia nepalensis]MBL7522532.1 23S ribosomal RNA methyltransferase Erm [Frankia nepalensis]MBL7631239.1 23S ribosomal RNA methyltransferase Erm [Frankia nepalensis]